MTSVKTVNYMLMEPITVHHSSLGAVVMPTGSFVSPVQERYAPKWILDTLSPFFNPKSETLCYTKYGFHVIAWSKLRAT